MTSVHIEEGWYLASDKAMDWIRRNMPGARIEAHARAVLWDHSEEFTDVPAVYFTVNAQVDDLYEVRKARFRPRKIHVECTCACKMKYVPLVDNDPCIGHLPGVEYACCGHLDPDGRPHMQLEDGTRIKIRPEVVAAAFKRHGARGIRDLMEGAIETHNACQGDEEWIYPELD